MQFKKVSAGPDSANLAHPEEQLSTNFKQVLLSHWLQLKHTPNSVAYSALDLLTDLFQKSQHRTADSLSFRDLSKSNFYEQRQRQKSNSVIN